MIWTSKNQQFIELLMHPAKHPRIINVNNIEWVQNLGTEPETTTIKTGKGMFLVSHTYEEVREVLSNLTDWVDRPLNIYDVCQADKELTDD